MCNSVLVVCLLLSCLFSVASTYAAQAPPHASSHPQPLEQHKNLGAVRLTLTADRPSMGLTDTLTLTLTIAAPSDVRMTLPEVPKTLGPFEVVQHRTAGPLSLTPQMQQWQREYRLAVTASGSLTVPALTVQVQDGDTIQPLTTDPLSITVTALVPADADMSAMKDIAPPVPLSTAWTASLGVDSRQRACECRIAGGPLVVVPPAPARRDRAAAAAPGPPACARGPGTLAASGPHWPGMHRGVLCARVDDPATVY